MNQAYLKKKRIFLKKKKKNVVIEKMFQRLENSLVATINLKRL